MTALSGLAQDNCTHMATMVVKGLNILQHCRSIYHTLTMRRYQRNMSTVFIAR